MSSVYFKFKIIFKKNSNSSGLASKGIKICFITPFCVKDFFRRFVKMCIYYANYRKIPSSQDILISCLASCQSLNYSFHCLIKPCSIRNSYFENFIDIFILNWSIELIGQWTFKIFWSTQWRMNNLYNPV